MLDSNDSVSGGLTDPVADSPWTRGGHGNIESGTRETFIRDPGRRLADTRRVAWGIGVTFQ